MLRTAHAIEVYNKEFKHIQLRNKQVHLIWSIAVEAKASICSTDVKSPKVYD